MKIYFHGFLMFISNYGYYNYKNKIMYKTKFEERLKLEFGDLNKIPKHFRKEFQENPTENEMFEYLKNHFRYNTMNSCNNCTSYANNIKIHNLGFSVKQIENWNIINEDNFDVDGLDEYNDSINENLLLFSEHYEKSYAIQYNGTSRGYFVIYNSLPTKRNIDIFPGKPVGNKYADYTGDELIHFFELVYNFDLICDTIRYCVGLNLDMEIEEYEVQQKTIIKKRFKN